MIDIKESHQWAVVYVKFSAARFVFEQLPNGGLAIARPIRLLDPCAPSLVWSNAAKSNCRELYHVEVGLSSVLMFGD